MIKKYIAAALALVLCTSVLSGCSASAYQVNNAVKICAKYEGVDSIQLYADSVRCMNGDVYKLKAS